MDSPPLDTELLEEYGLEAAFFARLSVEAELLVAAGVQGDELDARLAFFATGLLQGLETRRD